MLIQNEVSKAILRHGKKHLVEQISIWLLPLGLKQCILEEVLTAYFIYMYHHCLPDSPQQIGFFEFLGQLFSSVLSSFNVQAFSTLDYMYFISVIF